MINKNIRKHRLTLEDRMQLSSKRVLHEKIVEYIDKSYKHKLSSNELIILLRPLSASRKSYLNSRRLRSLLSELTKLKRLKVENIHHRNYYTVNYDWLNGELDER